MRASQLHLGVILSKTIHHGLDVPTHELLRDILIRSTNQKWYWRDGVREENTEKV